MIHPNDAHYFIRPVREDDLLSIYGIADKIGIGMSLPKDKSVIEAKIAHSIASFQAENDAQGLYFFVLVNFEDPQILGTAIIEAKAAWRLPFYNFIVETLHQIFYLPEKVNQMEEHKILYFSNRYQEASMLGSLYLDESARGKGQGQLVSRSRCLFISDFPELFSDLIIANMRGVYDADNHSPFWNAIGKNLFNKEHEEFYYWYLTESYHENSIALNANFAPIFPIYVKMLSEEAQAAIGKVHHSTQPALHVLEKEGLMYRDTIDFFDGGPIIESLKKNLKALQCSHSAIVTGTNLKESEEGELMMLSNKRRDYRALMGKVKLKGPSHIEIEEIAAKILNVSVNDEIRYYSLK